jgi:hypothetical protein
VIPKTHVTRTTTVATIPEAKDPEEINITQMITNIADEAMAMAAIATGMATAGTATETETEAAAATETEAGIAAAIMRAAVIHQAIPDMMMKDTAAAITIFQAATGVVREETQEADETVIAHGMIRMMIIHTRGVLPAMEATTIGT